MTQLDHLLPTECSTPTCKCESEAPRRFAAIFDRLADGFFSLDNQWRFSYLNPAARKALRAGDELLGQPFWAVFPEARETIFEVEFRRAMEGGATTEFEAFYPGLSIWLRVNAFPFDEGLAISISDVTEARNARLQLADLNQRLQERVQAHEEVKAFAHTVAHDLRSPLAAILGFSQALSEAAVNELGPKSAHYLRRIQSAARHMDELTEAIMGLCRVARAGMNRSLVDLGQMAGECMANLRDAEPDRAVRFTIAPGMWADCDAGLVKLAMQNLLCNAWKFTNDESQPTIEVGVETGPDQQPHYFVRDNGVGFATAESEGLFEPFRRLHGDRFAGEGIGLATVRRVVEKHGGALWAVSQPGKGSTFYFTLPPQDS